MELKDVLSHPYLRTDSYGKIFLYCTPNELRVCPAATPSSCPSPSGPMSCSRRSKFPCCVSRT